MTLLLQIIQRIFVVFDLIMKMICLQSPDPSFYSAPWSSGDEDDVTIFQASVLRLQEQPTVS